MTREKTVSLPLIGLDLLIDDLQKIRSIIDEDTEVASYLLDYIINELVIIRKENTE